MTSVRTPRWLLGAAALLLLAVQLARADPPPTLARQLWDRARDLYAEARYDEALHAFEEAYRVEARPAFLYNIARCHLGAGRDREALAALDEFLATSADAEDRASAQALAARIRGASSALARRRRGRIAAAVVGGVAVGAIATSLGTGLASRSIFDDLSGSCDLATGCSDDQLARRDRGRSLQVASIVTLAIGAGCGIAAIVTVAATTGPRRVRGR